MGILNSVALGKSKKSAGNVNFYNRIGVPCFRQKPAKRGNAGATQAQLMQQKVYRFIKINMDAIGLKSIIDLMFDKKPAAGKSQTKMNMFYKAFMPTLIAQKKTIYELSEEAMIAPEIMFPSAEGPNIKIIEGILGGVAGTSGSVSEGSATFTVKAVVLDEIIANANSRISAKVTPFTINDIMIGGVVTDSNGKKQAAVVMPKGVVPTLADGVYTFSVDLSGNGVTTPNQAYLALRIVHYENETTPDPLSPAFSTDNFFVKSAIV